MQSVITEQQARKITGGRTPLVPVEYEAAVAALQACVTLDEAKYWNDKADALAAWSKIYRNDEVGRKAKLLKLHAYRRMGQLAGELRPQTYGKSESRSGVSLQPGPKSLLLEMGLKNNQAIEARLLAKMPETEFQKVVRTHAVPSPRAVYRSLSPDPSWVSMQEAFRNARTFASKNDPQKAVAGLSPGSVPKAREMAVELSEWLDAFEQALPKEAKGK